MAKKTNTSGELVVHQITIRPPFRTTSDVSTWRTALSSADIGRIIPLYNLYEDLLIDGILGDAISKRIDAVTNANLIFQNKEGEEVPEMLSLIQSPGWDVLISEIMSVRFWSRAGVEFDFSNGFNVYEIPKKHIDLANKQILLNETDTTGISYENDDNLLVLGENHKFGLLLKAAPYVIWKRGGFGDYAQWLEIFGMPQRVGKYSSYDPESRKALEQALEMAGSAPWIVVPKESDIETIQASNNGSAGTAYNQFRQACNEELLITILGQTLTTVAGDKGARSLGDVHKVVEEGKNRSDMRFVQRVLNYNVLPMLEKRGFPVTGGKFVFPDAPEELSVADIVALSDILEIPAAFLHKKYAIPMPKAGESIARKTQPMPPVPPPPADNTSQNILPDQGAHLSDATRKNIFMWLSDFFVHAPARQLTGASNGDRHINLSDASGLLSRIDGNATFDTDLFEFFAHDFIRALDSKPAQLADLGFTYNYQNDAFRTAQELNIFHFSAAKTLAEITELNKIYRESTSADDFYKKASEKMDVFNKTWQRTEWQTATLIAASTDNYNRLIQKTQLFPYWEYKTVGDDRVRPEHAALDGIILPANDPRWNEIWPPNGWKCRCYVVPRTASEGKSADLTKARSKVDAYFDTPEWKTNKAQGFGINRAKLPDLFTEDQMYIKKFPTKAAKLLADINYQTYRLGSYEQNRAKVTNLFEPYSGNASSFFGTLKQEDGKLFFTDYNNRAVLFDEEKYLKSHDDTKYAERTKYLAAADEAFKTPDEVWVNVDKGFKQYVFLKYYNDVTVAAVAEIDGKTYRVKTWFPVAEGKGNKFQYRSGLLIKKRP